MTAVETARQMPSGAPGRGPATVVGAPWLRLDPADPADPAGPAETAETAKTAAAAAAAASGAAEPVGTTAGGRNPSVRLLCFPHAGAGASSFARWVGLFPPGVTLVRAQLPGREEVAARPPLRQVEDAVEALMPQVAAITDGTAPLALYGHSMGALVAFELARALTAAGSPPLHLFVSGRRAPHQASRRPPVHRFADDEFVGAMEAMGATDGVVPRTAAFLRYMVRVTRADLELSEEYGYSPMPRLRCPITAFYGTEDPVVDRDQVEAWRRETDAPFTFHTFSGGHFFHQRHRTAIAAHMAKLLSSTDVPGAPA